MHFKKYFFAVLFLFGFLRCGGSHIDEDNTPVTPTLAQIREALLADNPVGFVLGETWNATALPACTIATSVELEYFVSKPSWLSFSGSTLVVSLASESTVPDDAADLADFTYICESILGPSDSIEFSVNDLDEDSITDAVEYDYTYLPLITNMGAVTLNPSNVSIYRGGMSSLKVPTGLNPLMTGMSLTVDNSAKDTDDDGTIDTAERTDGTNVFVATSGASFNVVTPSLTGLSLPEDAVLSDVNSDFILDLVVVAASSNQVSVFFGEGAGEFEAKVDYDVGSFPVAVKVGDFNGDGFFDLAVANSGSNNVSILLNNDDGTFDDAHPINVDVGDTPNQIAIGDFDGDGNLDLAVTNRGIISNGTTVSVLLGNGDGTFADQVTKTVGTGANHITTADFNEDGNLDLAVSNRGSNGDGTTFSVLLGIGDGTFADATDFTTNDGPHGIVTGDFDGDGHLDIATANTRRDDGDTVSIFLGAGDGTFDDVGNVELTTSAGPFSLLTFDANGDGNLDLAVATFVGNIHIFLGDGTGNFPSSDTVSTTNFSDFFITVGDVDNDGDLDLVSSDFSSGTASVYLNE